MDDEEMTRDDAAKMVKRLVVLGIVCSLVTVAVLLIDQGIKRAVIDEVGKARDILDEFKKVAQEARNGAEEARQDGAGDSARVGAAPGVVDDTGAGTVLDPAPGAGDFSPANSAPGVAAGAPGDG